MAAMDIDYVAFGIICGGTGTDNTTVFTDLKRIKAMYFSGNADNATMALKTQDPSGAWVDCHKFKASDTSEVNSNSGNMAWFGETGSPFKGLQVNPSHADDRLFIHLV